MIATRMIPAMWIRLIAIIAFGIFMAAQSQTLFVVISIGLAGLTVAQLIYAYRQKGSDQAKYRHSDVIEVARSAVGEGALGPLFTILGAGSKRAIREH